MSIQLIRPLMGEEIHIMPEEQRQMRAGLRVDGDCDGLDWRSPTMDGTERSFPLPVEFEWRCPAGAEGAVLHLSTAADFADAREYPCEGCTARVDNLLVGQTYWWRVTAGGMSSPAGMFVTSALGPRLLRVEGITNVRELGGWTTVDGRRVRQGLFYRGSEMDTHCIITDAGRRTMRDELRIRTDLDLRGEAVGRISASPLGEDVRFELLPVRAYAEFCAESDFAACRAVMDVLCDPVSYPVYMHCWGGADRTGTLALLVGAVLGMDDEDLMQDYELTSFSIWKKRVRSSELFRSLMEALDGYGTPDEPLRVKVPRYLLAAGVTQAQLDTLRAILLED